MKKNIKIFENLAKLRWSCRRGMLELDLLLNRFLERKFLALTEEEQVVFTALLKSTDQELFAWLMFLEVPLEARFLPILQKIREQPPCK